MVDMPDNGAGKSASNQPVLPEHDEVLDWWLAHIKKYLEVSPLVAREFRVTRTDALSLAHFYVAFKRVLGDYGVGYYVHMKKRAARREDGQAGYEMTFEVVPKS